METKKVKFRETAQMLLERHGAAKSFKLLFFLKNSIFHYWEDEMLGEQIKKLMLSANWLLDDVAEALLLEVFGEEK